MIRASGGQFFNPDEIARETLRGDSTLQQTEIDSLVWARMVAQLERAIEANERFIFETTLGGKTITGHLERAAELGRAISIWYVALESVELHLERIRIRVAKGGHGIDPERVRQRYNSSRANLVRLMPVLYELRLYDNSRRQDDTDTIPEPNLVLSMSSGRIKFVASSSEVPTWAKPLVAAGIALNQSKA